MHTDRQAIMERVCRLVPGHTALLVVDMQRGFLDPGAALEVPPARAIVPVIQQLLAAFRRRGWPVAFSEFVYDPALPLLVGELHPEHQPARPDDPGGFGRPSSNCLVGHPSAATVMALAPEPGEIVVRKHGYDAFAGTALDGALRARRVQALVVTGTMTDICVLATVVGAFHREYRVIVVEDGVATLWPDVQRATLDIIGRAYGRVARAARVLEELAA